MDSVVGANLMITISLYIYMCIFLFYQIYIYSYIYIFFKTNMYIYIYIHLGPYVYIYILYVCIILCVCNCMFSLTSMPHEVFSTNSLGFLSDFVPREDQVSRGRVKTPRLPNGALALQRRVQPMESRVPRS